MRIDLISVSNGLPVERKFIKAMQTDDDGHAGGALLAEDAFRAGLYEMVFHVVAYFDGIAGCLDEPPFLDQISIRIGVSDRHYHIPLLSLPHGYPTYRGN